MYVPKHFAESRPEILQALLRDHPVATLVCHLPEGIDANHIPLLFTDDSAPHGTLRGHIARANSLSQYNATQEVLAIFQGPDAYITPSWYATKQETGKVVPTWNYAVVHAYGTLRIIDDPVWLRAHLEELTTQHEASFETPWRISDAPDDYIQKLLSAIVGIEIVITRMVGKWKTSQNQPPANRVGVVEGLYSRDEAAMAKLVAEHE